MKAAPDDCREDSPVVYNYEYYLERHKFGLVRLPPRIPFRHSNHPSGSRISPDSKVVLSFINQRERARAVPSLKNNSESTDALRGSGSSESR